MVLLFYVDGQDIQNSEEYTVRIVSGNILVYNESIKKSEIL